MAKHLLEAVKIVHGISTVTWMAFLEPPRDGTLMLVWQSPRISQYASDGYMWADDERAYSQPMKGFVWEYAYHFQKCANIADHGDVRTPTWVSSAVRNEHHAWPPSLPLSSDS